MRPTTLEGYRFRAKSVKGVIGDIRLAERLGHSSVVITLDTYSHLLPGMQEAAAAMFDDAMNLPVQPRDRLAIG